MTVRQATPNDDLQLEKDLVNDPKKLLNIMLDLGRNMWEEFLNWFCKTTDKMIIEKYSHVMHMV